MGSNEHTENFNQDKSDEQIALILESVQLLFDRIDQIESAMANQSINVNEKQSHTLEQVTVARKKRINDYFEKLVHEFEENNGEFAMSNDDEVELWKKAINKYPACTHCSHAMFNSRTFMCLLSRSNEKVFKCNQYQFDSEWVTKRSNSIGNDKEMEYWSQLVDQE